MVTLLRKVPPAVATVATVKGYFRSGCFSKYNILWFMVAGIISERPKYPRLHNYVKKKYSEQDSILSNIIQYLYNILGFIQSNSVQNKFDTCL